MKKWLLTFVGIIFIIFFIWGYIKIADFPPSEDPLLKKINELELKIDSLKNQKDSIRTVIDSTHVKIITNEKHYKERINTVIVQSVSADSSFISDYIRLHRNQRDSTHIR